MHPAVHHVACCSKSDCTDALTATSASLIQGPSSSCTPGPPPSPHPLLPFESREPFIPFPNITSTPICNTRASNWARHWWFLFLHFAKPLWQGTSCFGRIKPQHWLIFIHLCPWIVNYLWEASTRQNGWIFGETLTSFDLPPCPFFG